MRNIRSICLITLLWMLPVVKAGAQSVKEMDVTISKYLDRINRVYAADKMEAEESDTLRKVNKELMDYMKMACTHPEMLDNSLPNAEAMGFLYATSDDNKVRFYAWDTWTGSSMHYFNVIAQYKSGNVSKGTVINEIAMTPNTLHDPGAYVSDMITLHSKDGKTIYLTVDCTIASAQNKANRVQAYSIENGELMTIPFFRTDKDLEKEIDVVYNYAPDSTSPEIFAIRMNDSKDKLYVPFVQPNGRLSREKITYDFDGYKFVLNKRARKKLEKGL